MYYYPDSGYYELAYLTLSYVEQLIIDCFLT